jgi:1,4-alpha-glucan branching enzyme
MVKETSLFTDYDIHLFKAGTHYRLYEKMGAHLHEFEDEKGVYFAVWAPNARRVSVIGDFNFWSPGADELFHRWDQSGIWEGFIPGLEKGTKYKFHIESNAGGPPLEKGDPFAVLWESPPKTASVVWDLDYSWKDKKWMSGRKALQQLDQPFSVYEVHLGSWRRKLEEQGRSFYYTELADELVGYVKHMAFTHVELLPVMEHPFFGSWGYQITGYFAPSSRFGSPQEFMYLIEKFHEAGIGVILDWVPSHFPGDAHGLSFFDGTHLYEHADPRKGYHPDWKSYIFNYDRNEVRSFLISNAIYWLDKFHADGLRVDAVASMLYLDYSRNDGEWIPNEFGGRENLGAISFLKEFNEVVYRDFPDVQTIAEESTAWPMVSRPVSMGGLGFGMKWMMGWMHDTLKYFKEDPLFRPFHHDKITFSIMYAFSENFMLPLSHDEVVHGKGSLITKMPGDEWQKFANLRMMFAYMYTHPGAKLLFMGAEVGQIREWNHDSSIDWHLLDYAPNKGLNELVRALNLLYKNEEALHDQQFSEKGFEWIDGSDRTNSVITYMRQGKSEDEQLVILANFTPVVRHNYRIGVPAEGSYEVVLNTDDQQFWGSGVGNGTLVSEPTRYHWKDNSLVLTLAPLSVLVLKRKAAPKAAAKTNKVKSKTSPASATTSAKNTDKAASGTTKKSSAKKETSKVVDATKTTRSKK